MKIIFVVAADLARDKDKRVTVGPETKLACDKAIIIAKSLKEFLYSNVQIVVTAGIAGPEWDGVNMSHVMAKYLHSQIQHIPITTACAQHSNTSGEMQALAKLVKNYNHRHQHNPIKEIVLAVKWWHAPRSWCLCSYWLSKENLRIPVKIGWCHSRKK